MCAVYGGGGGGSAFGVPSAFWEISVYWGYTVSTFVGMDKMHCGDI